MVGLTVADAALDEMTVSYRNKYRSKEIINDERGRCRSPAGAARGQLVALCSNR